MLTGLAGAVLTGLVACAPEPPSIAPDRPFLPPMPSPPPAAPDPPPAPAIDPSEITARFEGIAPTNWGLAIPGIATQLAQPAAATGAARIALTFDACGGPGGSAVDGELIDALRGERIPATLFLNARWIDANPALVLELAADPLFVLANHGTAHRPLSVNGRAAYGIAGTASAAEAVAEVWENHVKLADLTGVAPRYFRSGTAHYDDVAVQIVRALGEIPVGFSLNGDGGATYASATVRSEVGRTQAGGIVIGHMNQPQGGTYPGAIQAVHDLRAAGVEFVHLDV